MRRIYDEDGEVTKVAKDRKQYKATLKHLLDKLKAVRQTYAMYMKWSGDDCGAWWKQHSVIRCEETKKHMEELEAQIRELDGKLWEGK